MTVLSGLINLIMGIGIAVGAAVWIDRAGSGSKTRRVVSVVIGVVLGAAALWGVFSVEKLETTAHYSRVDSATLKAVKSPLEMLDRRRKAKAS